jgi:hypothetical protein
LAATGPTDTSQVDGETAVTQTMTVDLRQNGDARWTITKTFNLTSEDETEAFGEVARDFEEGRTDDLGLQSFKRASQQASDATDRDMSITNVTRSSSQTGTATNGTGELSISFTWTNFGRIEGENLYIDDVFATGWLGGLSENQQLIIRPPEGYQFFDASVSVTLRNGTIQWTGPRDFTGSTLSATFEQTGNFGPGNPDGPGGNSLLWIGLVALGLGAVVVYLLRDSDVLGRLDDTSEPDTPATERSADNQTEPVDSAADDTTTAAATGMEDSDDETGIDEELLSDEERVERLLEENGGRMKQANIVKETNWSNAKVSQLLSSMEEDGEIDKLRIGRENLISFPDEDVADPEE